MCCTTYIIIHLSIGIWWAKARAQHRKLIVMKIKRNQNKDLRIIAICNYEFFLLQLYFMISFCFVLVNPFGLTVLKFLWLDFPVCFHSVCSHSVIKPSVFSHVNEFQIDNFFKADEIYSKNQNFYNFNQSIRIFPTKFHSVHWFIYGKFLWQLKFICKTEKQPQFFSDCMRRRINEIYEGKNTKTKKTFSMLK